MDDVEFIGAFENLAEHRHVKSEAVGSHLREAREA